MSEGKKFEYLGAIRGIAAFIVLLAHIVHICWLRIWGLGSWQHAVSSDASYYSVVVFFILSGFLITHSIEANVARNGVLNLTEFFAARFARIYPPFLFAILVSVLVYACFALFALPGGGAAHGSAWRYLCRTGNRASSSRGITDGIVHARRFA